MKGRRDILISRPRADPEFGSAPRPNFKVGMAFVDQDRKPAGPQRRDHVAGRGLVQPRHGIPIAAMVVPAKNCVSSRAGPAAGRTYISR